MDDVITRSAIAQSALVRDGQLSVESLTRAYLARVERLDHRFNAFAQYAPDHALATARALDRARARDRSIARAPLWGVPTAMKDIHLAKGMFARLGSRSFRYFWSPVDDVSTAAVRRAGMVIMGKLATSELAILPVIDHDLHPPTRNPWDVSRYSGGSSGGSSAAISAGMMPVAVASDGAGSIRIPAAFCGLIGHKPTRDLVPNPFARFEALSLSVIGPHARSVDDAAALLDVLRAEDRGTPFAETVKRPPSRLRVRFTTKNPVVDTEAPIADAVRRVARALESLGHDVEESLPFEGTIEEFLPMFQYLAHGMFVPRASLLQPVTKWLRESGKRVSLDEALARRDMFRARVDAWMGNCDVFLTPTVARYAPTVGAWSAHSPEDLFREAAPLGAFTAVFNASGNPATTIPLWSDGVALPAGVQLVGGRGRDAMLLSLARVLLESFGTALVPLAPAALK